MLIEFKITRRNDRVIGVESSHPEYPSHPPDLPLFTKDKISVMTTMMPNETAASFYNSQIRQMK